MRYVARRLMLMVPLLFSVTLLVFAMLKLIKGDPAATILGTAYTDEAAGRLTKELGLDRPFFVQYFKWVTGIFRGDLGYSYISREPVWNLMKRGIPVTATIIVYTMVFTLLMAIPLGVYSAYRVGGRFDRIVSGVSFGFLSMPGFVIGLLGLMFISVRLNLLPAGNYVSFFESPWQCTKHMILPCLSLSLGLIAQYLRILRTDMVSTLQEDFVTLAKTKGLTDQRILWRHAFRPSSVTLTTVAGVTIGGVVQCAAHDDLSVHMKSPVGQRARFPPDRGVRKKCVEHRAKRIHFKLVVARMRVRRFQENLEHVVPPHRPVVLTHVSRHIGIVEFSEEINPLPVPEQPHARPFF